MVTRLVDPSMSYEDAQRVQIDRQLTIAFHGRLIDPEVKASAREVNDAGKYVRILRCICVQDSPDNPCPCEGPIVWLPRDKILTTSASEHKDTHGQRLAEVVIANDAQVIVERHTVLSAKRLAASAGGGDATARAALMKKAGASKTGALLIAAFELGYHIGTTIDEETGASDAIADALWDLFNDK